MKNLVSLLKWLMKAAVFFTLFAFALNNQQMVIVHGFFGNQWQTAMVLVVLASFGIGIFVGVAAVLPWWWQHRQIKQTTASEPVPPQVSAKPPASPAYPDGI